jgi:hypothetical protein
VTNYTEPILFDGKSYVAPIRAFQCRAGRLQGQVYVVETIGCDPLDFFKQGAAGIIHDT